MNKNHMEEIKKEDKKAFKPFIAIVLISGIIGGIIGVSSVYLKKMLGDSIPNLLMSMFEVITPFASIVLSILVIIISTIAYNKSRKEYDLWSETNEDDDIIDKIEERLSYILLLTSVNMILGFFFFGVGGMLSVVDKINYGLSDDFSIINFLCLLVGFILCMASSTLIQKKIVNLGIFKSAYKAYKSVSTTCAILWFFCFIGYILWDFGMVPMVMVIIIWLVQTISYCVESIKQSKSKLR